ncbi:hypothetical protein LTR84_006513 [Exophiala bonariae]|uniref:PEBP-like protein n=1 Tax=Exophiala bonariae TaxID=1690606 RepID=A0AAV9N2Z9_9EURO|nr:hypothetical protein LTR84_006513 [Exophiala bonariae]
MKNSYTILAPLVLALATAQSAPDFYIEVENNLRVLYEASNTEVTPPGVLLARDLVLEPPTAFAPQGATNAEEYILFMIDQDVPRNGSRVALLHYFAPNLLSTNATLALEGAGSGNESTAVGASYIPPTPPGGDGPHRYTFLLYAQPNNFTIPAEYTSISPPNSTADRVGFDIVGFAEAAGLGQPLAANYLRVLNGTAEETSSAATASATSTGSAIVSTSATGPAASTTSGATSASETASESAGSATSSAATSATSTAGNGAASVRVHNSLTELMAGLLLGVVGAGMFML